MSRRLLADRLAGERTDGDVPGLEGRWRVNRQVRCNGHTNLQSGDLLLSDGTPVLHLDGETIQIQVPRLSETAAADLALALTGIRAIAARTDFGSGDWPSPVLPSELAQEADRTGLDDELALALEQGHLDEIARRPRLDLRYDSELVAVDRARRLATGFQRHLAAHSECWAARRLSGILPKAVLARVSEDNADLYEHRVYARLLDHLERNLRQRIRRIERLTKGYEKALDFENAEAVDYRLRNAVCKSWGEATSPETAAQIVNRNGTLLQQLRCWLKRILEFKGRRAPDLPGSLYDSVPRGARVGLNLQATNLLQHDPHYRHLRLLWQAWLTATASNRERPAQVLARRREEQQAFERYVGLVVVRSLRELNFQIHFVNSESAEAVHPGWDERLTLRYRDHQWTLSENDQRVLTLLPSAVALDTAAIPFWRTQVSDHKVVIPCVPWSEEADQSLTTCLQSGDPALVLSPLDLYCEEGLVLLISAWCWRRRLADYGKPFDRLPMAVDTAWPKDEIPGCAIRRPISDVQWALLDQALTAHANSQLCDRVRRTRRQVGQLAHCPVCAASNTVFSPSTRGFYACCRDCNSEWKLKDRKFDICLPQGQKEFQAVGRHAIELDV